MSNRHVWTPGQIVVTKDKLCDHCDDAIAEYKPKSKEGGEYCLRCLLDHGEDVEADFVSVDAEEWCRDCGEVGETTGHMGCPYPNDHDGEDGIGDPGSYTS